MISLGNISLTAPLTIQCVELADTFIGGIDCTSVGGTGPVSYSCIRDNSIPVTPCTYVAIAHLHLCTATVTINVSLLRQVPLPHLS